MKSKIKLSVSMLAVLVLNAACGGDFAATGLQGPKTFDMLNAVNSASTANVAMVAEKETEAIIAPTVVGVCHLGDLDVITKARPECGAPDLLITVKDKKGERLLKKTSAAVLKGAQGIAAINAEISKELRTNVTGEEFDILVCLDGTKNDKCGDEPIKDVNNELVAKNLERANPIPKVPDPKDPQGVCPQGSGGLLMYHEHYKITAAITLAPEIAPQPNQVGKEAQLQLRNFRFTKEQEAQLQIPVGPAAANDPRKEETGLNRVRIPLAMHDQAACPQPQVRTNGCFARETRLNITPGVAVRIDSLYPNAKVLLADGRQATIKKVVAGPEKKPMIAFETDDGDELIVTSEHPMYTQEGVKKAKDVRITDKFKTMAGKMVSLRAISQKPYAENVYNVELEGSEEADHLLIAEGLVTGDLYLQQKLQQAAPLDLGLPQFLSVR